MGNYKIEFVDLINIPDNNNPIDLLKELNNTRIKDMLQDIEKILARPLSPKEMTTFLCWQNDFNFTPEIILLLIEYCASKGKTDSRYIEKIAITWHENRITNIDLSLIHIFLFTIKLF